jgi:putative DNA primase/helicase
MEDENNNNQHSPNRFSLTDPSNQDLDLSNLSVKPLLNSLSPNLRLKILSPPKTDPEKQKNYTYVVKTLISLDFSDQEIELLIKSHPIGLDRSNISADILRIRESDPGEEKITTNFVNLQKNSIRYDHNLGKWLIWNKYFWEIDEKQEIINLIRLCVRDTEMPNFKKRASIIRGVEFLAKSDPLLATKSSDWDSCPWLLATPNGTVDLRTGKLRLSYPEDQITKSCSVSPQDGYPKLWIKFLLEATQGNQELINYLQRMAGYCLTGSIQEESLFFLYGEGGNGKGTFINTISAILGTYAVVSPMETFVENKFGQQHPTSLAMLKGARLVTAQETEEGKYWNESQIKSLTGGDPISARLMYEDFFTFMPQFKLVISGNHEPNLKTVDQAIKRRFNKLPFIHKPYPPDIGLKEKLKEEYPQF